MPQVIHCTKTLYQFSEIDDRAKETARDWFRECIDSDYHFDAEDFQECAVLLGVTFTRHDVPLMNGKTRQEPAIYWSGFSRQGDGACFEGSYSYRKGAGRLIREHAPLDKTLHSIADRLQAIQRKHFYSLTAAVKRGRCNYSHEYSVDINVSNSRHAWGDCSEAAEKEIAECLRDFMRWIYRQIEAGRDYCMSAEYCDESIEANEYTFTEDGKRAD